ncbi:hypothetical protein LCGC14_2126790, partial [marine sediment metagenome]
GSFSGNHNQVIHTAGFNTAGILGNSTVYIRHAGIASHAFRNDDDTLLVNVVHDSTEQATYFLLAGATAIPAARMFPGLAGGLKSKHLNRVQSADDNQFKWTGAFKNQLTVVAGSPKTYTEKAIKEVTFDFDYKPTAVQLNSASYLPGGVLTAFDGQGLTENNFLTLPENVTLSGTAGGSMDTDGVYTYNFYWEWYDNVNQRHLSDKVAASGIVMVGSEQSVNITVDTLGFTYKREDLNRSPVRLAVFRTENAGTNYFRIDDPSSPTFNDYTADKISFTDTLADSAITSSELDALHLETPQAAPLAGKFLAASKERLFMAGLDEGSNVLYTKINNPVDAAAFTEGIAVRISATGQPITALATMDDNVIVFTEDKIYTFGGLGPSNTGVDDFSTPTLISTDVGCDNQNSIVRVPKGLMFSNPKGIHLLNRDGSTQYVGAPVEAYNSQTITSAHLIVNRNQVQFLVSDGLALVYNYFFNQWSTFTNYTGVDAALWKGDYVFIKSDGQAFKESATNYNDVGRRLRFLMETGWIPLGNGQELGQLKSIYILGEFNSPHILKVSMAYDYLDNYSETHYWDPSNDLTTSTWGGFDTWYSEDVWGGSSDTVYQKRFHTRGSKVQAVRVKIEEFLGGTTLGASFELNQLVLQVRSKQTNTHLPKGKQ